MTEAEPSADQEGAGALPGVVASWDDDDGSGDIEVSGYGLVYASFSAIATPAHGFRRLVPGQRVLVTLSPRHPDESVGASGSRWVADHVSVV